MTNTPNAPLIDVRNLVISIDGAQIVAGLDLRVHAGQCVALVGESGAGKSMTGRALMGLLPEQAASTASAVSILGQEMYGPAGPAPDRAWRGIRGRHVGLVSQDALVSLDPLRRVGQEVAEPLEIHGLARGRAQRRARVHDLLTQVAMDRPERRAKQFPHELSGGLRQRALIAAGLAADPEVLIADEPTTALDATVAAHILELLDRIKRAGTAIILISHDLAAVAQLADHIVVLKDGVVVEQGPWAQIFAAPREPYTRELLAAVPTGAAVLGDQRPFDPQSPGEVLLRADGLRKQFPMPGGRPVVAVADMSLDLHRGQTLGLVGESGSGKSTLARLLLALEKPDHGTVTLSGTAWNGPGTTESARRPLRARIQMIPQDPYSAMNKRWTVTQIIDEFLSAKQGSLSGSAPGGKRQSPQQRTERIGQLMAQVGLGPELAQRLPGQLSGGQRQRVAIARALAMEPEILICDEVVSALDVTVQAQVIELLAQLQTDLGLAMIFISHDLAVVRQLAHTIVVLKDGEVVERGPAAQVYANPSHPYTRELLAARRIAVG